MTRDAKVYYAGPCKTSSKVVGGYASANERVIRGLRALGLDVVELPYFMGGGGRFSRLLGYVGSFAGICLTLIRAAAADRGSKRVLHLTGLYKHFVYPELLVVAIGKLCGFKVVYDLRAGSAEHYYREKSFVYRHAFRALLREATSVLIEGKEYASFVRAIASRSTRYLPNFVNSTAAFEITGHAPSIRLIYFGRINADKGIHTSLDVTRLLLAGGKDVRLDLIGSVDCVETEEAIKAVPNVHWHGVRGADYIESVASQADFFLFPSRHLGEGHSNSLTEAMGFGLVPIVSRNGFLESVTNGIGAVLPKDSGAAEYVEAILRICSEGTVVDMKRAARAHVARNYVESVVLENLVAHYAEV